MKATLEFTLPEDQEEFTHATNGVAYFSALQEMRMWLRGKRKASEDSFINLEDVWREFHDLTEGFDV